MTHRRIRLDARLSAVAAQVRDGITLYDVGTDHAYLPVFLAEQGRISRAIASDVAEGPLASAVETVSAAGLTHQIETALSDGLQSVTLIPPCDVVMAGMGGDLMIRILSDKPEIKQGDIRLILQPMTKQEHVRRYLSENGFAIEAELVAEEGKLYEILVCRYTGVPYALTEEELLVGRRQVRREDPLFYRMVDRKRQALGRAVAGKRRGGETTGSEEALMEALDHIRIQEKENDHDGCKSI